MPTYEILVSVHQSIRIRVAAENEEMANAIAQFHYNAGEAYDGDSEVVSTTETDEQPDISQQEIDLSELGLDQ
jgi:hypothetical protein